jgi:phospholipid/cholesterol/gamma-HCH transport system substrate-binding protein
MSSQRTEWRDLIPGILLSAAIIGMVMAVLLFVRIGAIRGAKTTLYATAAEARGLLSGSDVWLAGQRVGNVTSISFLPATSDSSRRLLIEFEMLREHIELVRRDSYAQIRTGGSLIGAPVFYVAVGTPAAPALAEGDTLPTLPQGDPETVAASLASASKAFPEIINNVKRLNSQFTDIMGSEEVMGTQAGLAQMGTLTAAMGRTLALTQTGTGTAALALNDTILRQRVVSLMAGTDSVRALLASPETSLGRFRRDSTLVRSIASLRADMGEVRALLEEPAGTAGRALNDDAIPNQLGRIESELAALMADIRRNPLRYLVF